MAEYRGFHHRKQKDTEPRKRVRRFYFVANISLNNVFVEILVTSRGSCVPRTDMDGMPTTRAVEFETVCCDSRTINDGCYLTHRFGLYVRTENCSIQTPTLYKKIHRKCGEADRSSSLICGFGGSRSSESRWSLVRIASSVPSTDSTVSKPIRSGTIKQIGDGVGLLYLRCQSVETGWSFL